MTVVLLQLNFILYMWLTSKKYQPYYLKLVLVRIPRKYKSLKITTTSKKVYNYSFSTTIASKPSLINLFFVNEGSYIDGSSLVDTGIAAPVIIQKKQNDGKWYNLAGQQVDKNYKGVVIVNGRKFLMSISLLWNYRYSI